jgi:hypothetical protein
MGYRISYLEDRMRLRTLTFYAIRGATSGGEEEAKNRTLFPSIWIT